MTHPYLPGVPAPSDFLVQAARLLSDIEYRERRGEDVAHLEAEYEALLFRFTLEAAWAKVTRLPKEALV